MAHAAFLPNKWQFAPFIRRLALLGLILLGICCETLALAAPDRGLAFLEARVQSDPDDFPAWNLLAERYLAKLRETGENEWGERAAHAADASLKAIEAKSNPGGLGLRARADLATHRFVEARDHAMEWRQLKPDKSGPLETLGDALLELGELEQATAIYEELRHMEGGSLNVEARFARLAFARGNLKEAREHFTAACDLAFRLNPESPLLVAWCEVQLGELDFRTSNWDDAEKHYQTALVAVPGWWAATEHLAELRGAQGRDVEAVELYEEVISKTARPELCQALGDLFLFLGRKDEAKPWHDRALSLYLSDLEKGRVQYFHHLAGFFCDSQEDPTRALVMARKDLEVRHTSQAHDALAWALYKSGDVAAAALETFKALESGIRDSHLFYHAGLIRISAGDLASGQDAMREAARVNPRFNTFHVHR